MWPTVLARLTASSIHNYSIYQQIDLRCSSVEHTGDDYEADMAAVAANPRDTTVVGGAAAAGNPLEARAEGERWREVPVAFGVLSRT